MRKSDHDEELNFYYNRNERLKRASPSVTWMMSLKDRKKQGFFGVLTANKTLSSMLIVIVVILVFTFGYGFFTQDDKRAEVRLLGNSYTAQAFVFRGEVLISVKKLRKDARAELSGAIRLGFELESGQVSSMEGVLDASDEQVFRHSMPISGAPSDLKVKIETAKGKIEMKTRVKPE
jgi:hypothetical protein